MPSAIGRKGMMSVVSLCVLDVEAVSAPTLYDVIGIGTGVVAPAVTDEALGTWQQSVAGVGTAADGDETGDVMTLVNTFSFSGAHNISEAAFTNSTGSLAGDQHLLSRSTFTAIPVTATDTLQVTYNIQVKQGSP